MSLSALTTERVDCALLACVTDTPDMDVEGLFSAFRLERRQVEIQRDETIAMLAELPDKVMDTGGGGCSFLELCTDRHGYLWTGLQRSVEKLIILGCAADLITFPMPRHLWPSLPGGMPYVTVCSQRFFPAPLHILPEIVGLAFDDAQALLVNFGVRELRPRRVDGLALSQGNYRPTRLNVMIDGDDHITEVVGYG